MNSPDIKLFYSTRSPFVRKVRVVIREKKLLHRVQEQLADAMSNDAELLEINPLGKVPAMRTTIGPIFDSPVMCEYLDQLSTSAPLLPQHSAQRFDVLRLQALADGIMDAAVSIVQEQKRPVAEQSSHWIQRWHSAIERSLLVLDSWTLPSTFDLGAITTACALDYLSFRHPDVEWSDRWPGLRAWAEPLLARRSMQETTPFIR